MNTGPTNPRAMHRSRDKSAARAWETGRLGTAPMSIRDIQFRGGPGQPGERHTQRSPGPVPSLCGVATAKQVCGSKRVGGVDVSWAFYQPTARAVQFHPFPETGTILPSLPEMGVTTIGSQMRREPCSARTPGCTFTTSQDFQKVPATPTRRRSRRAAVTHPGNSCERSYAATTASRSCLHSWTAAPLDGGPNLPSASDVLTLTRPHESEAG
jgi:hypothetical protein